MEHLKNFNGALRFNFQAKHLNVTIKIKLSCVVPRIRVYITKYWLGDKMQGLIT